MKLSNPNAPATSKQLYYLHLLTKQDTRDWKLTIEEASTKINELKGNGNHSDAHGAGKANPIPLRQIFYGARQRLNALEHLKPELVASGHCQGHSWTIKLWKRFEKHGYHGDYTVYSIYLYKDGKARSYGTTKIRERALATIEQIKSMLT